MKAIRLRRLYLTLNTPIKIIGFIAALCSLVVTLPIIVKKINDNFGIGTLTEIPPYFLLFFLGCIYILRSISLKSINFIPTIATTFRFIFGALFIAYIFFLQYLGINNPFLVIITFFYLIYCLILTSWFKKPTYADGRVARTVIDIIFSFIFCLFCGDPFLIFYLLLFVPVCVISRYSPTIEIYICILVAGLVYILSISFNYKLYHIPNIPEIVRAFSVQIERYNNIEWFMQRYYIEIIILILVGSIFAVERRKELNHKNLMENISECLDKKACVISILQILCERLNIELGLIICKEGQRTFISHGYSIKEKTSLIETEFGNLNNMRVFNSILVKSSAVPINEGISQELRRELINSKHEYEDIIRQSILITYLCTYISNTEPQYYFLLFNKLTRNRRFIRRFTDRDKQISKTVGPLIYKCINDLNT
ncbi:MAG: hypothetical protein ACYC6G_04270 [Desulfobaccales bacterium]